VEGFMRLTYLRKEADSAIRTAAELGTADL
jgi:hypothetical protein